METKAVYRDGKLITEEIIFVDTETLTEDELMSEEGQDE